MKTKTGIVAGDGDAAGGEALTVDNAPKIMTQALVDTGLITDKGIPAFQAGLDKLDAQRKAFEKRVNSTPATAEWFVNDDIFHNGIPAAVRSNVKDKVRAAFSEHRGDQVFPGQYAAQSLRATVLSAVSKKGGSIGLALAGARQAMDPVQFAAALYGEEHPVALAMAGKLQTHDVASDRLDSDKMARIGVTIPDAFLPGFVEFLRPRSVFLAARHS